MSKKQSVILSTLVLFTGIVTCRSQQSAAPRVDYAMVYEYSQNEFEALALSAPVSDGFDFPICKPHGKGCYDAQPFGKNDHLGEDWNAGSNNKDLGAPVFSSGDGVVVFAKDVGGGWGNVLRVVHRLPAGAPFEYIEILYAHFRQLIPKVGSRVKRGEKIGTMGTAGGLYEAHLHLEIRSTLAMPIGGGYGDSKEGFLEPKVFIRAHRPRRD